MTVNYDVAGSAPSTGSEEKLINKPFISFFLMPEILFDNIFLMYSLRFDRISVG